MKCNAIYTILTVVADEFCSRVAILNAVRMTQSRTAINANNNICLLERTNNNNNNKTRGCSVVQNCNCRSSRGKH